MKQDIVVRFAPSPNGLLHLGHAYAAILAHDYARTREGTFLLRIEDIDTQRSRQDYVEAIIADLDWLGLRTDGDILFQSHHFADYESALERLISMGMVYPCFCSRSDMRELEEQGRLAYGPDGPIYPGTCRDLQAAETAERRRSEPHSWRLNARKSMQKLGQLQWQDERLGVQNVHADLLGDVVIRPRDIPVSYHLAVTLDDAASGISHVVRGEDLYASTHVHRILQALLELPEPTYFHHRLLLDETGVKLSKSRESASLAVLRKQGCDGHKLAHDMRNHIFPVGITLSKD